MRQNALLFHHEEDRDALVALLSTFSLSFSQAEGSWFELSFEEDSIDWMTFFQNAKEDLFLNLKILLIPHSSILPLTFYRDILPKLKDGLYDISTLIQEVILSHLEEAKFIRNQFLQAFGYETIETIHQFLLHDMNVSKASKSLYMHRNTVYYKLENFIQKSEIDVRHFQGAFTFELMFH